MTFLIAEIRCRFKIPDVPEGWKPDPQRVWALTPQSHSEAPSESVKHGRPDASRWNARGKTAAEEVSTSAHVTTGVEVQLISSARRKARGNWAS